MRQMKQIGVYLVLCVLLAGLTLALAAPVLAECLSVLRYGWGTQRYLAAASGSGGTVCVIGHDGSDFILALGDQNGHASARTTLRSNRVEEESQVAALYPASDGSVFVGFYQGEIQAAEELVLYRQVRAAEAEILLRIPCSGSSPQERRESVRLSSFSENEGVVAFAVLAEKTAELYRCTLSGTGLESGGSRSIQGVRSAVVLPDGALVTAGANGLRIEGRQAAVSTEHQVITGLTQAGAGLFYVDSAGLKVFYTDLTASDSREVMRLDGTEATLTDVTSFAVTQGGDALLLQGGHSLQLYRGDGTQNLTAMLYWTGWQCVLILVGLCVGVLLVAALLWYFICLRQNLHLPMLLRLGVPLAAAVMLCTELVLQSLVWPVYAAGAQREAVSLLESVTSLALQGKSISNGALPNLLGESLSAAADGGWRDTEVTHFTRTGENWLLAGDKLGLPAGSRVELSRWAPALLEQGGAVAIPQGERIWYGLPRSDGGQLIVVALDGQAFLELAEMDFQRTATGLRSMALMLVALVVLLLASLTRNLRRVTRGMEQLTAGDATARVDLRSGDELEGLATAFNSMAATVERLDLARNDLARCYLRFVPERVLSLLGKDSIAQVDKTTFAIRRMSAMMIWFGFPDQVYDSASRALFDNINEVIEHTAGIVSRQGGAVFNFAYNGYDVVLEGGSELAVSTAVAVRQEVLALNERRAQAGRPPVTLRIALDVGDLMMGVVGDEQQMEPTAISTSFSTTKRFIELCNRLDANILCTERILSGVVGYGSRYIGKCAVGGELIRTYEIFDGDPYDTRRAKQLGTRRFSEGVYALYAAEFSKAKRIFLELVHDNQTDGGARYYLYQADRLEQSPDQEISLDG